MVTSSIFNRVHVSALQQEARRVVEKTFIGFKKTSGVWVLQQEARRVVGNTFIGFKRTRNIVGKTFIGFKRKHYWKRK